MHCPNIKSPEWKSLVNKLGENNAWREFFKYGDIPSANNYDVIESINIEQNALEETEQVKTGVEELFDSNPELANEVYEALGFNKQDTNIKDLSFELIDSDSEHDYFKIFYKGQDLTTDGKVTTGKITLSLHNQGYIDAIEIPTELKNKGLGKSIYRKVNSELLNGSLKSDSLGRISEDAKRVWESLVKSGEAIKTSTGYEFKKNQITPQQKQQALQLYSQYLDSIFPDSQVKDIVYHDGGHGKIKEEGFRKDLIGISDGGVLGNGFYFYFDRTKKYAENRSNTEQVLINVKNPKEKLDILKAANLENGLGKYEEALSKLSGIKVDPKIKGTHGKYIGNYAEALLKIGIDGVIGKFGTGKEIVVFEPEQIHILGNQQDIKRFKNFVDGKTTAAPVTKEKNILYSIKTKSVEEIAKGLNTDLIKNQQNIKYTGFIKSLVLNKLGDIAPGKKLKMSPEEAFASAKFNFETAYKNIGDFINIIKNEDIFNSLKEKDENRLNKLLENFYLTNISSFNEAVSASNNYKNIIDSFEKYVDFVKIDLAHSGIRIVENKIKNVDAEDTDNKNEDESNDSAEISQNEIGERHGKENFEYNARNAASPRVKALIQTIATGEYEFGIPLYANPTDVFADILEIGADIDLSGFNSEKTKLIEFKKQLADRAQSRPYLNNLLNKIIKFEENNEWDKINDILKVTSKAYAIETVLLYQLRKNGSQVTGAYNIKVISTNRDSISLQISKEWLEDHKQSDFYTKDSQNDLYPKQSKIDLLNQIIEEGANKDKNTQIKKFQEFFNVMGINLTENEVESMYTKLPKVLNKGSFNTFFSKKELLKNIVNSFEKFIEEPFQGQYGFEDEKTSMQEIAKLYYEVNPGRYKISATKTADNKSKYAYILPSYVEQIKREWKNGNTSSVLSTAFAKPNANKQTSFWNKVTRNQAKFKLDYFNGIREQKVGENGKVRKSTTAKEQIISMYLLNQQNLNVGNYISFTLSDKTSSIQTAMTKEFFVNTDSNPVGIKSDYNIVNSKIEYTEALKKKAYNSFVEPEISRILESIKNKKTINIENYEIASKLFYILPNLNRNENLSAFRDDLYSGKFTIEQLSDKYSELVGGAVINEIQTSTELEIDNLISIGVIKIDKNNNYSYPFFINGNTESSYVNAFRKANAAGRNMARLMVMDMKLNYMNAQVKTIQYLKFDPVVAFKTSIDVKDKSISDIDVNDRVDIASATWDEFSKRAAALIAPGTQGSWFWKIGNNDYEEAGKDYITVTAKDIKVEVKNTDGSVLNKSETTDAQEFVTMQEHIDYLMSEGNLPYETWLSIYNKIKKAGPGGYYNLTKEELSLTVSPTKPVYVNYSKVGDDASGLTKIDYVKSSRYPLIPQHEAGSERDKLRIWMEKNNVRSVNFGSAKKLGRPTKSLELFDKDNNFVEPSNEDFESSMQMLSRDGIRNQQEIPEQKDKIRTVSQMNRTMFDGLLNVKDFNFGNMKNVTGTKGKELKEAVRSKLFEIEAAKLKKEIGNLNVSHEKLYELLKGVIENDTTGSYSENDLIALEINPETKKFKIPLEAQWKLLKFQSLINSLINNNVMLKVEGSSFVQVSGVGSKYTFSKLSKGIKSEIIWLDKHADDFAKDGATLKYIRQEGKKTKAAQVIVSQYLKDDEGNLIDLTDYITEDKYGRNILDTSKMDEKMFQLVGTRIPNQSHPSTLPIEVVGFLPGYMENSIVVPDGITGQMGSDFDVDKLYAYFSKFKYNKKDKSIEQITYELNSIDDVNNLDKDQLNQLYRDIHWEVLTNPATFDKITKAVDMPEVKEKVNLRNKQLEKYNLVNNVKVNLPLDYMTSLIRYIDNRAGKTGVSIFATLISAQADFQDKIIQLKPNENGTTNPVQIKLSKNSEIISLEFIGKLGESTSFLDEKRSISENLNIMFSESVDNAKNQFLKEFNWTEKAMGSIGLLAMLTDGEGNAAPIDFMMDLTSQQSIIDLFKLTEQKQDSFGQYDNNALINSAKEIQDKIIEKIDNENYLPLGKTAESYFDFNNKERNKILDAETLAESWIIGKAIEQKASNETLESIAKDLKYGSVNEMMLNYYNLQFNTLEFFTRLESAGRELMTILGAIYPYTKGIGANVFSTKQKLNQLNILNSSTEFTGLENIAGDVFRAENGDMEIDPTGEIGSNIYNSLIFAQNEIYKSIFPISSGKNLESIMDVIFKFMGTDKFNLSKDKYQSYYTTVFNSIISYTYTNKSFELFDDVIATRNRLINGDTSIGHRILEFKKDPKYSKNGFLKNIEVLKDYKTDTYTISFKDPFGTESNDKEVTLGFYNLALDESNDIKELAKDLALYPFATGDAGYLGRYIPVGYLNSDADFNNAMANFEKTYVKNITDTKSQEILIDQIVQNNPEIFSKSFSFVTTVGSQGAKNNGFKTILKEIVNANRLKDVNKFTFKIGDFPNTDRYKGIIESLKIPLTTDEQKAIGELPLIPKGIDFKYPQYILIKDEIQADIEGVKDEKLSYLYKRTSSLVTETGDATYERIEILGYKNISEFDFNNPNLVSVIEMNNVSRDENELNSQEGILQEEVAKPTVQTFTSSDKPNLLKNENGLIIAENVIPKSETIKIIEQAKNLIEETSFKQTAGSVSWAYDKQWMRINAMNPKQREGLITGKQLNGIEITQKMKDDFIKTGVSKGFPLYGYTTIDKNGNKLPSIPQNIIDYLFSKGINVSEYDASYNSIYDKSDNGSLIIHQDNTENNQSPIITISLGRPMKFITYELKDSTDFNVADTNNTAFRIAVNAVRGEALKLNLIPQSAKDSNGNIKYGHLTPDTILKYAEEIDKKQNTQLKQFVIDKLKEQFKNAEKTEYDLTNGAVLVFSGDNRNVLHEIVFDEETNKKPMESGFPTLNVNKAFKGLNQADRIVKTDDYRGVLTLRKVEGPTLTNVINEQKLIESLSTQPTTTTEVKPDVEISSNTKINIYAGTGENAELSNFAKRPFEIGGVKYNSVEQAFQHAKLAFAETNEQNLKVADAIMRSDGAMAKSLGRKFVAFNTKEWDSQASSVMKTLLKESFKQNPEALAKLQATGNATLTHTQDTGKWNKEFPKLLMEVRDKLQDNNVKQKDFIDEIQEDLTEQTEDKIITVEYGNKTYILEESEEDGYDAYTTSAGQKSKLVTDKSLLNKINLTHVIKLYPERVITLTNMQNKPSYYVDFADRVISLTPSNYGKQITSSAIYNKVMSLYKNEKLTPIQDEPVAAKPESVKYEPNYIEVNGKKLETFKWDETIKIPITLTNDQKKAIKKAIDHFEKNPGVPFILKGKAGTGKTTVIRVINEYFNTSSIIITPTHKAGKNASIVTYGSSQNKYATYASKFSGNRSGPKEELLIFDEVSMLGELELQTVLRKVGSDKKVFFVGDQHQLPPIKATRTSPFFNSKDNSNVYELTEVMRFDEQGSIFKIADRYAENLKNYTVVKQFPKELISTNDSVYTVDSSKRLVNAYMHYYKLENNDPSKVRLIVYGNKTAELYNNEIRNVIFEGNSQMGVVNNNDLLTGNAGWSIKNVLANPMVNSGEYKVIKDPKIIVRDYNGLNVEGQSVTYKEIVGDKFETERTITILDPKNPNNKDIYNKIACNIINMKNLPAAIKYESEENETLDNIEKSNIYSMSTMYAKVKTKNFSTGKIESVDLYTLDQLLTIMKKENPSVSEDDLLNMIDNDRIQEYYKIEPNVSFGYAITTHKSEGSTYKHVMVDESNMSYKDSTRKINDQDDKFYAYEANQMRYVAFSRPTTSLVIYTKKAIGDELIYGDETVLTETEPIDFNDLLIKQIIADSQNDIIEEIFGKNKTTASILNSLNKNTSPFYKQILSLISKTGGVGNLKIVVDETMTDPGSYSLYNETISINPKLAFETNPGNADALFDVLIHELLHHVTAKIVNSDKSKLTLEQRKWVTSLENLFKYAQDKILNDPIQGDSLRKAIDEVNKEGGFLSVKDKSMYYGLTSINEFISMLMSDKDFRNFMNNTSYSNEKNLFERFIDIFVNILKSLGITVNDDSVLKEGIGNIIGIIESRNEENVATDQTLKSIKTKSFLENMLESEFDKILNYLDIKTKCK